MTRRALQEFSQLAFLSTVLSALVAPAAFVGRAADFASCSASVINVLPILAIAVFIALGLADILSSHRR